MSDKKYLGIELGSTRIKAVLIDEQYRPIASGGHNWENRLENGIWTYPLGEVWQGLQQSFSALATDYTSKTGEVLTQVDGLGISAMMHGYLAFDKNDTLLVPFRTWRNTTTERAATELTELFNFNIPQRWTIAHLHQAILDGEQHVKDVAFVTTLAGYVHWKLTGEKVLGIGDASGMFPIDSAENDFNTSMLTQYDELVSSKQYEWSIKQLLPRVLVAGDEAGRLTPAGARLLDPSGRLQAGVPLCPPEGDAGTGMVATNSVAERTGNVSAGTSIFAMIVLEKALSQVYTEIDMVTTPTGRPVAMVHCNNCTSDLDAWIKLFGELLRRMGNSASKAEMYDAIYQEALNGDADAGGLLSYNYYSGEPITGLDEGRPVFVRRPDSALTLPNFARSLLFSAMATLKIGMDILTQQEQVRLKQIQGHGGLFKTPEVGQRMMAAALNVPVTVMELAGEGGAWGIALLAAYQDKKQKEIALEDFLESYVFASEKGNTVAPQDRDIKGFDSYMSLYKRGLIIEKAAVKALL